MAPVSSSVQLLQILQDQPVPTDCGVFFEGSAIPYCHVGPDARESLHHLAVRLSEMRYQLPRRIYLSEVATDSIAIAQGGYGDVYRGRYQGKNVAVKSVREYRSQMRDVNHKTKKAS